MRLVIILKNQSVILRLRIFIQNVYNTTCRVIALADAGPKDCVGLYREPLGFGGRGMDRKRLKGVMRIGICQNDPGGTEINHQFFLIRNKEPPTGFGR